MNFLFTPLKDPKEKYQELDPAEIGSLNWEDEWPEPGDLTLFI